MDPRFVHTFIVKLWREGRTIQGATPEWRVGIRHVQTGKLAHFRDVFLGLQFVLQTCLECSDDNEPGRDGSEGGCQ